MTKKYLKIFGATCCFVVFLCVNFLILINNTIFAADLEIQYPTISGQTLTASSGLPNYFLYLFNAGVFLGFFAVFLSLIAAGVMYLLSPVSAGLRAEAKDRISGAISGLLILILSYLIITIINPQLSILTLESLPPSPPIPVELPVSGVYFYTENNCSNTKTQPSTTSITNFNQLNNKINSVKVQKDNNSAYISILYDNPGFWGRCQYINPTGICATTNHFADSASIYTYESDSNGEGVYFYRKSFFNDCGGYLFIPNRLIKPYYAARLESLSFTDPKGYVCGAKPQDGDCTVSKEEQDCVKYDENGKCTQKSCPTLAGENISSVEIKGDYLVLFIYRGPTDSAAGPWTSCQEFPTSSDVNKTGPQQVKWQNIRNGSGADSTGANISGIIPNYVVIIPIQR